MQAKLKELVPDLASESFRLGFADDGALGSGEADAYRHMMLVSVRLDDGSWVNFSSTTLGATQHADWSVLAVTICFGVAIVVVAVLLLRWATRPLRDLAVAAERFSLDQTPQPLNETGPAEVRRAARAFNTMRERIQRLVSERMQALAAVSHDLRTPITRLRLRSELMEDEATRDLVDADLAEMEGMIDSTLEFLRGGVSSETIRPIDIITVIKTIVDDQADQGRSVTLSGVSQGRVLGRLLSLKRAFWNIVGNAVKYGSHATVAITETPAGLAVTVEDNGPGICDGDMERVFQPFVRLDESRGRETGGYVGDGAANGCDGDGGAGCIGSSGARGGNLADIHDGEGSGEASRRILRLDLSDVDVDTERLRAPANEFGIAEQIERRNLIFRAALPGGDRDIRA
ncbi:MAG: HAMP domain-containing protein, partial [Bosea sp.]|nr:HAMP domain-containing protein [Bosea sp. (in: a-proteobacteria)]